MQALAHTLERITALIARTASPFEEEARTSAVIACRLIRENRLEIVPAGTVAQLETQATEPRSAWMPREVRFMRRSRFAGWCFWCGEEIPAGSRVAYYPTEKAVACLGCHRGACS
jgi:hypothetical protein